MGNPFLDRIAKRGIGGSGRRSEKRVALDLGARLTPASGAMAGAKGDSVLETSAINCRIEKKSTVHQTMKLEREWLAKITQEALTHGQVPALVISFVNPDGSPQMKQNSDWVMIPKESFIELTHVEKV